MPSHGSPLWSEISINIDMTNQVLEQIPAARYI